MWVESHAQGTLIGLFFLTVGVVNKRTTEKGYAKASLIKLTV